MRLVRLFARGQAPVDGILRVVRRGLDGRWSAFPTPGDRCRSMIGPLTSPRQSSHRGFVGDAAIGGHSPGERIGYPIDRPNRRSPYVI